MNEVIEKLSRKNVEFRVHGEGELEYLLINASEKKMSYRLAVEIGRAV